MSSRNNALDFLRFVAIILVMFRHLFITGESLPEQVAWFIKGGGGAGVDLFFVLSGFLVSGLIFDEYETHGTFSPTRFLIRRGFKIYPAFYLFLGFSWIIVYYLHSPTQAGNLKFLYEALFICNYTKLTPMHTWLWSICVEEHFYILLCILMTVLIRLRLISLQTFFSAYLFFLVIGLGIRIYNLGYPEFNFFRDYTRSHIRFDSLFFGVLLNYMYRRKKLTKWKSPVGVLLALAGVSLSFLFSMDDSRYTRIDSVVLPAINPVCFGYLMIRMLPVRAAWMKPFAYIGKYSYPIYLFHGSVNDFAHRFFTGWEYGLAYFSISLIVGIFISKILEYPLLALRDKWFPGTAPVGL